MSQLAKDFIAIALGLVGITLSNIQGHFHPPFSISSTPILLALIIAGINYPLYQSNFNLTIIYNYGLLLFNDIFIRVYAGGDHDDEGRGWIFVFFSGAFILSTIAMFIYASISGKEMGAEERKKLRRQNALFVLIVAVVTGSIYCICFSGI